MIIDKKNQEFIKGNKFSNGFYLPINQNNETIKKRTDIIINNISGKKTIHLGCCDHIELIDSKILNKTWLHNIIKENAKQCIGIDINKTSIGYLKDKGIKNIYYGDIAADKLIAPIVNEKWDIMIMGEILEHTDNPIFFLQKIKENYSNSIKSILVTVPNAFSIENFKYLKKGFEVINSDHRYWFTPFTLAKIVSRAGYKVKEYHYSDNTQFKLNMRRLVRKPLATLKEIKRKQILRKYPGFCSTIVMLIEC